MAAIRHSLQKEIFDPSGERLLVSCEVCKLLKKKKTSYLCIARSIDIPSAITVIQVKKLDKNILKKKRIWLLSEIKSVDGGTDTNVLTLDIVADKQYRWIATNEHDRQLFVTALSQGSVQNKENIEFLHFPDSWIGPQAVQSPDSPLILPTANVDNDNEYQTFSDIEETELASLLGGCDSAINNAEEFMQQLGEKLSTLDGQNIESMLASETQVESLMNKLEEAISYAEVVETRLDRYDDMLRHVRDTMDKMEEKNGMIETANRNSQKLLQQLKGIIGWLDMTGVNMDINLTTPEGRESALQTGNIIRVALNTPQPVFVERMVAYTEQWRKINKYKDKFTQSVTRHLNNLLIHRSNDASQEILPEGLVLPNRSNIHTELKEYAPLMHWIKQMDPTAFAALTKVYVSALSKLYDRDIKHFLESARTMMDRATAGNAKEKKGKDDGNTSVSKQYDSILDSVLTQLETVCINEQEFCVIFFQLEAAPIKSGQQSLDSSITSDTPGFTLSVSSDNLLGASTPSRDLSPGWAEGGGGKGGEARRLLGELFASMEQELATLIAHYEKIDTYGSMRALARLAAHVSWSPDAPHVPHAAAALAACLVRAKRGADRAVAERRRAMADAAKITSKRNKCGILPYIEEFEEFCTTAESIFGKTGRRADLDKWYVALVSHMVTQIQMHEHPKTPSQVIQMENFHHLYDLLSQLKLAALDGLRKQVKIKYNEALKAYVTFYFGRPLEKLNQFFEGVQERVNQGVKEEEISYQSSYSKQELRKVIALYPHKEVKKGLDSLYRKVEKHLCEEENLLQVVWHAMQEEFITQYKYLEGRIHTCYAGSMILLDFTIKDILDAFSDIARSH